MRQLIAAIGIADSFYLLAYADDWNGPLNFLDYAPTVKGAVIIFDSPNTDGYMVQWHLFDRLSYRKSAELTQSELIYGKRNAK